MKKEFLKITAVSAAFIMSLAALSACGTDNGGNASANANTNASAREQVCYTEYDGFDGNSGDVKLESGDTYAVISVEKFGDIKIKLFPKAAPVGVQNFIDLANSGFYTGKNIHRVMSGFMLQGGSLNGNGTGGEAAGGGEFYCEINNKMRHYYGALCYANAGGKNTCQFYIVNEKTPQTLSDEVYDQYITTYKEYADAYSEAAKNYSEGSNAYIYYSMQAESFNNFIKGWNFMKGKNTGDDVINKYAQAGGVPFLDGSYTVFGQTVEGFDVIDAISAVNVKDNGNGELSSPVEEILISSVTIYTA